MSLESNLSSWKEEHAVESFPFEVPPVSDSGRELPNGILSDLSIVVRGTTRVKLSRLAYFSGSLSISFSDDLGSSYIASSSNSVLSRSSVNILNSEGVVCGKVVFSAKVDKILKSMQSLVLNFESDDFFVASSCVLCLGGNHITGINVGGPLRGSVVLREGTGVQIRKIQDADSVRIKLDAVGEEPEDCCPDNYSPLKTINGVSPDELGEILISEKNMPEPDNKDSIKQSVKIERTREGILISLI
jgi:hypothetical protein